MKLDYYKLLIGIRNVANLEFEVKCKTIYWDQRKPYFYLEKEHLEKHLKMEEFTKTPIILAIYEREKKGENPIPNKLHMIDVSFLQNKVIDKLQIKPTQRDWGLAYRIPVDSCQKGFELIEFYKKKYKI